MLVGALANAPRPAVGAAAAAADTLETLAAAVAGHPGHETAMAYRQAARRAGQLDSAIAIMGRVLAENRDAEGLRFELAMAQVDRLPARPALDLTHQAVMASQAIRLLTEILAADPENWGARYARGMIHLSFPRSTKHYEPATEDLRRLVELQRTRPPAPCFARSFQALGDAYVMDMQLSMARSFWEAGRKNFPDDPALAARLEIPIKELEATVVSLYGFAHPFDTDLDCLWPE
jgi:tetratricopeptide (TPR) repeat protein